MKRTAIVAAAAIPIAVISISLAQQQSPIQLSLVVETLSAGQATDLDRQARQATRTTTKDRPLVRLRHEPLVVREVPKPEPSPAPASKVPAQKTAPRLLAPPRPAASRSPVPKPLPRTPRLKPPAPAAPTPPPVARPVRPDFTSQQIEDARRVLRQKAPRHHAPNKSLRAPNPGARAGKMPDRGRLYAKPRHPRGRPDKRGPRHRGVKGKPRRHKRGKLPPPPPGARGKRPPPPKPPPE